MNILEIIQRVCSETALTPPTSVVASTEVIPQQLLNMAERVGNDLRMHEWTELQRKASITLVAGQEAYAFPADIDSQVFLTHWNETQNWPLIGPLSPQEWEMVKSAPLAATIAQRYRIKGYGINRFFVDPIPTASEAGQIVIFEYQSMNWVKPKTWETGAVFAAGSYAFYDGNYYITTLGGTTGPTPPTHTTGSASDGTVSWTYSSAVYSRFLADTDEPLIDPWLLSLGTQWNYLASRGQPHTHLKDKYFSDVRSTLPKKKGAHTLDLTGNEPAQPRFFNVPETGFGT